MTASFFFIKQKKNEKNCFYNSITSQKEYIYARSERLSNVCPYLLVKKKKKAINLALCVCKKIGHYKWDAFGVCLLERCWGVEWQSAAYIYNTRR